MKVKVESVNIGVFDYDSIIVKINNNLTEIIFDKKDEVKKYDGKTVELINTNGIYKIKEVDNFKKN